MKVERKQIVEMMTNSEGKIFTVVFIKKDGTVRSMNCRKGVTSHLSGGELKFSPEAKGLTVVFDMQKGEYRMVNVNTIQSIKIGGNEYEPIN